MQIRNLCGHTLVMSRLVDGRLSVSCMPHNWNWSSTSNSMPDSELRSLCSGLGCVAFDFLEEIEDQNVIRTRPHSIRPTCCEHSGYAVA